MAYPFNNPTLKLQARLDNLISRLTLDEKIGLLSSHNLPIERLGIGEWHIGTEVARGLVRRGEGEYTTVLPQPIGMASGFDVELMYELGTLAGNEARIYHKKMPEGNLMLWGPTVDMLRDPRWGRNEEAYGEDPFLTGTLTAAYTSGLKGNYPLYMKTFPTLKHFCADNNEDTRATCSASIPLRLKYDYYYEAFRTPVVGGGARGVMTAYNCVCGIPAIVNPELQTVLKDDWGIELVVTDGGDFTENVNAHHYSKSHAETLALALKAGNDVMVDVEPVVRVAALEALRLNLITIKDIDIAVENTLAVRMKLGEFDEMPSPFSDIPDELLDCEQHRALNRRSALEGITLLKNDGILPLSNDIKLALVGYGADELFPDWYTGIASYGITVKDGLISAGFDVACDDSCDMITLCTADGRSVCVADDGVLRIGDSASLLKHQDWGDSETTLRDELGRYIECGATLTASTTTNFHWFCEETIRPRVYDDKVFFTNRTEHNDVAVNSEGTLITVPHSPVTRDKLFSMKIEDDGIARAAELARNSDVAVVCVGNNPMFVAREAHDRKTLELTPHDKKLIKAVSAANPNTVLLVISSYPYAICEEQEKLPAIIYTCHAGAELGNAIAQVLSGDYNPAGRTPQTWYKSHFELPDIEDYDIAKNKVTYLYNDGEPLYPFGFGLSYSEFTYDNFILEEHSDRLEAKVTVSNVSDRDGDEVVQIYFRALDDLSPYAPLKKLCGFKRAHIKAHETVDISIVIPHSHLEHYDVIRKWRLLFEGDYHFFCGSNSSDKRLEQTLHLCGEAPAIRKPRSTIPAHYYDSQLETIVDYSKEYSSHFIRQSYYSSKLTFDSFPGDEVHGIELFAAGTLDKDIIEVFLNDSSEKPAAVVNILPPTAFNDFRLYSAALSGNLRTLHLRLDGNVRLMWFRLF